MTASDEFKQAREIARGSGSNLALALITLPKERRRDMITYYAFCRVVDDIVDDGETSEAEKKPRLDRWRRGLAEGFRDPCPLERGMERLRDKYAIPPQLFHHLIDGMEMDIQPRRYETFAELKEYCFRVAGSIGLVCVRIFGCENVRREAYGENLGYFLQLTNIIRDVGEDWGRGRIYLPREDLLRHGYKEEEFGQVTPGFRAFMECQYERALEYYRLTSESIVPSERRKIVATEAMRALYLKLLQQIRDDGFQVFQKRYRLGRWTKTRLLLGQTLRGFLA